MSNHSVSCPRFHQSPVVLLPVANLISEAVVAFAHPLAYQGGERWGWSQISATTPGSNLNQIARWANTYKTEAKAAQIEARSSEPLPTALTREVFRGLGPKSVGCKMRPM